MPKKNDITQEPFINYKEKTGEEKKQAFTIWLNDEERRLLDRSKAIIEQPKDSTAIKQLAWIGANLIGDKKMAYLLGTVFKNKRNNKRLGIVEFEV